MIAQVLLSGALTFVSIVIHMVFVALIVHVLEQQAAWISRPPRSVKTAVVVGSVALWLSLSHGVSIALWALAFLGLGIFADHDTAVYFAGVSFTTLGFGDIIPPREWRHLAGLCAANGLLLFGVSSAVLVEVFRQIWVVQKVR